MSVGSAARWEAGAAAVLRRAGVLPDDAPIDQAWWALATTSIEGVVIPPLGTADRVAVPAPGVRGRVRASAYGWDIRALLTDRDAGRVARDALVELEGGVTSLWLTVGGAGVDVKDIPSALADVYLDQAAVVLRPTGSADEVETAGHFTDLLRERGVSAAPGTNLGADPIGRGIRRRRRLDSPVLASQVRALADLAGRAGVAAFVMDATTAHDAGAAEVAELGYSMALAVRYLRELTAAGHDLATSLGLLEFRYSATVDEFLTIAKHRAARALWQRVLQLCGVADDFPQRVHAVSSAPIMTRDDPWGNLLRGTIAAFAAGVGGADAVTVLPFDGPLGKPEALGRRLARNTSSLLISEARVAQVSDPAGGAYAIEMLTADLAARGWAEFQRIEQGGGVVAAANDGSLLEAWTATAAERRSRIADRRQPITGVTEFPDQHEGLLIRERADDPPDDATAVSWAADFEQMRDDAPDVPVFLALLGPVPEHNARATFVANAFAAGGIQVRRAGFTLDEILAAYRESGCDVVALAGGPQVYRSWAVDLVAALRAAGARWIVTAGAAPAELAPVVDDQLVLGANLLQFLSRTREHLPSKGLRP